MFKSNQFSNCSFFPQFQTKTVLRTDFFLLGGGGGGKFVLGTNASIFKENMILITLSCPPQYRGTLNPLSAVGHTVVS